MTSDIENELLAKVAYIRAFEEKLLALFAEGQLFGTTHTCIGQELCAATVYHYFDPSKDIAFSNHRGHGHFIAAGGDPEALLGEIMGRESGICRGRGGSQHVYSRFFLSQGVQGQSLPIAVGWALRQKALAKNAIAVSHLGDGTLGQGVVYESFNLASLLGAPVLMVLEHNGVAQSTSTAKTLAGGMLKRFEAFGIACSRHDSNQPLQLVKALEGIFAYVRGGKPYGLVLDTFRLRAHSKGDDDRPQELIAGGWQRDWFATKLGEKNSAAVQAWEKAQREVAALAQKVNATPPSELGRLDVFAEGGDVVASSADLLAKPGNSDSRINQILNSALQDLFAANESVMMIGEDLADPYGGAFKVSKGLSTRFGNRIISAPISEAAIVGFANGWALAGGKAIAELMFGDFVTLAAEQIINQSSKMHFMYDRQVSVPVTVRLASGGYRGYGATHSQTMESLFCGVPGLKVVALSRRHDPARLMKSAVFYPNPTLLVENKMLYSLKPHVQPPVGFRFVSEPVKNGCFPPLRFASAPVGAAAMVTLVTYGGLTDKVERVMEDLLLKCEVDFDYFVLTSLDFDDADGVLDSARQTGRVVTVEEGRCVSGVFAEIGARIGERLAGKKYLLRRVGAMNVPIPTARHLEDQILPSEDSICSAILAVLE